MHGRVKSALRLLYSDSRGTPLALDKVITSSTGSVTVSYILQNKHPSSRPVSHSALLPEDETPSPPHPILFESITWIGEVARRIIGKAILSIVKDDILKVAGVQQLVWASSPAAKQPYMQ